MTKRENKAAACQGSIENIEMPIYTKARCCWAEDRFFSTSQSCTCVQKGPGSGKVLKKKTKKPVTPSNKKRVDTLEHV